MQDTEDQAYARRVSLDARAEVYRASRITREQLPAEQRVRISGLTDRPELNGLCGIAGPVGPNGRRHVVLDGHGGAGFALRPSNLSLAPPAPADAIYNRGTGHFQQRQYGNNGLPRRLKAGSGRPAYSTRTATALPIAPPIAGSLLPRNDPPAAYHEAWQDGSLPVRASGNLNGPLRWLDPSTGAEVTRHKVDARRWLPLLIDGLRDEPSTGGCYVALRGAIELAGAAAKAGHLPSLMPAAAPALKAALDRRERACVCAALRLLLLLLHADERAGLALRPHYKQLLPALAAFKQKQQPSLRDEIERAQHRRINVEDLIDEALALMEAKGGSGAGAIIKSYVPAFHTADEVLHRGFR